MGHLGNKTYQHSFLIAKEETEGVFFMSFFSSENIYKFSITSSITSEEQYSITSEEEKNNIQISQSYIENLYQNCYGIYISFLEFAMILCKTASTPNRLKYFEKRF